MLFYAHGLKFGCKRCSACCRYDAGFVFLTENDVFKLSKALKMEKKTFMAVYCRWVSDWNNQKKLSLKEKTNKDCVFWKNGCEVYPARPSQCVNFPFWESVISSKESWDAAATGCPGINSGRLFTKFEIDDILESRSLEKEILKQGENE